VEEIMKAIWKGYLKCSLVTIPIKMYNVIGKRSIQFNLLHKDCGSRVKQERICPRCNKTLSAEEIVRGYQYGKDMFVVISDEDLKRAQKEPTDTIEIVKFIDDHQIHPIYYSDSHYLVPDGRAAVEAFALFHKAMTQTKKAALAKVVMRNREHLLSIRPYNGTMIAFTLHYSEEIQRLADIEGVEEIQAVQLDGETLAMAKTIIENLSGDFDPEQYEDEYTHTLLEIIKAKAEGEEIKVEPKAEREKVVSLMDALKMSVMETEKRPEVPKKAMATAGLRRRRAQREREKGVDAR